jgi:hypothetical protein
MGATNEVFMSVTLDNGTSFTFSPPANSSLAATIATLDKGHTLLRDWLTSQLPPERQPVEHRSGVVRLRPVRDAVARAQQPDPTDYF